MHKHTFHSARLRVLWLFEIRMASLMRRSKVCKECNRRVALCQYEVSTRVVVLHSVHRGTEWPSSDLGGVHGHLSNSCESCTQTSPELRTSSEAPIGPGSTGTGSSSPMVARSVKGEYCSAYAGLVLGVCDSVQRKRRGVYWSA